MINGTRVHSCLEFSFLPTNKISIQANMHQVFNSQTLVHKRSLSHLTEELAHPLSQESHGHYFEQSLNTSHALLTMTCCSISFSHHASNTNFHSHADSDNHQGGMVKTDFLPKNSPLPSSTIHHLHPFSKAANELYRPSKPPATLIHKFVGQSLVLDST